MATKVINVGRVTEHPVIVLADGTKTSVRIMPRRSVTLDPGATVDGNWKALYGSQIMVRDETPAMPVVAAEPAPTPAPTPTPQAKAADESKED